MCWWELIHRRFDSPRTTSGSFFSFIDDGVVGVCHSSLSEIEKKCGMKEKKADIVCTNPAYKKDRVHLHR